MGCRLHQAGTTCGASSQPDLIQNHFLIARMLRFLRHSRSKCRKLSFSKNKEWGWTTEPGPRTEDWGPRTEDWGLRTEDWGLRTKDGGLRTEDSLTATEDQRLQSPFFWPDVWVKSESNRICLSQIWVKTIPNSAYSRHIPFRDKSVYYERLALLASQNNGK